jgi:thioredoxin reductase (NADPH)
MHDLIILGGGAAGYAAAVYALDKRLDVLLICEDPGGKAGTQQVLRGQAGEEYLPGAEAVQLLERQVTAHAEVVIRDRVLSVEKEHGVFHIATQRHGLQQSRTVLVATGATPLTLDVPGAKALINYGVGYSITTHTNLLSDKAVAVVGTTRRALRGVAELARTAAQVYLIAPDATGMTTPLARPLRRLPNVAVFEGYAIKEIVGVGGVERIVIEHDGERSALRVDAIFADLGLLPNSGIVRQIVATDPDGFVTVDAQNATTLPGMFAAGDVTTAFGEQMLIAAGDGTRAAASAYDYLLAHASLPDPEPAD